MPFPKLLLLGGAHISQEKWLLLYRGREDAPAVILADAPLRLSPIPSTPVSLQATPVHTSLPLPLKPRVSGWEQNPSAQALKTNVPVSGRLRFSPADSSPLLDVACAVVPASGCVGWGASLGPNLSPLRGALQGHTHPHPPHPRLLHLGAGPAPLTTRPSYRFQGSFCPSFFKSLPFS